MIEVHVWITSTGNMYAKLELAITFTTGPSFMFKKVLHDGTLIEEQEIILANKREQKLVWIQTRNSCTLPKVLMHAELTGWSSLAATRTREQKL